MTIMMLPNKHVNLSRSALGVGAILLDEMAKEHTVSALWERVRKRPEILTFERFVLVLDMLFALGLVTYNKHKMVETTRK